jgi:hypothetical protein
MSWLLIVCTSGWIMCGQRNETEYPDSKSCYQALESLYKHSNPDDFKYVICQPKPVKKEQKQ